MVDAVDLGMAVAIVTLPASALAMLFVGWQVGISLAVVGWFLLTPLLFVFGDRLDVDGRLGRSSSDSRITSSGESADPVEALRGRYARGEIDEAEFERRLDGLLETEHLSANLEDDESDSVVRERER